MATKDPNHTAGSIGDIFDEALELDNEELEDLASAALWSPFTDEIESDPTFYDEQVINVPVIESPGLKKVTAYPDTQIYDQLFSLDEEDDIETPEEPFIPDIEELPAPSAPKEAPVKPIPEERPAASVQKTPGKKPPVRRAGEKKPEPAEPAIEEAIAEPIIAEEEKPIRKKPRVKKAGEKSAPAESAPSEAVPAAKKAPAKQAAVKPAAGGTHAPAKAAPAKPAAAKTAPSKKAPSKPATAKATGKKADTVSRAVAEEDDFDDTVDLITWEEGSSVKVAKKQAAARRAEKLAFLDRFKKKLGKKFL